MFDLTLLEKEIIHEEVNKIKADTSFTFEKPKSSDKLMDLYQEIIEETSKHGKSTIIFDYAKLLEEENQLYSAEQAYLFAKHSNELNREDLLMQYLSGIVQKINETGLSAKQQKLFNKICALLGDSRSLITDFTQTYRKVNGFIAQNIKIFIKLGYTARPNICNV